MRAEELHQGDDVGCGGYLHNCKVGAKLAHRMMLGQHVFPDKQADKTVIE